MPQRGIGNRMLAMSQAACQPPWRSIFNQANAQRHVRMFVGQASKQTNKRVLPCFVINALQFIKSD